MGKIVRGAVDQGESFRGNCLGGKIPGVIVQAGIIQGQLSWGQKSGENFMGVNCPDSSCPGGNHSGAVVCWVKVQERLSLVEFQGRQLSGGKLPSGELSLNLLKARFKIIFYNCEIQFFFHMKK